AVLREHLPDLQPGGVEQIAEGVLVLVAVHPPPRRTSCAAHARILHGIEGLAEGGEELPASGGSGLRGRLWRHLARGNAVDDFDPEVEVARVLRPERRREVQLAAGDGLAVAGQAVLA